MSVLLVEDDMSIAIVITAALEDEGFSVTHCDTIAERDRLLAERSYEALVTDVMLPDGDGIETIERVRALHPDMPILILSAQNTLDTAVRATDTGAFEYFPKPFDIDELALVAEAIHQLGNRRNGPFIAVNTAAIPAELIESELFGHEKGAFTGAVARHVGKFEQAAGGTLFLDEIGDMPMQAQTRLLRALQSGTVRRVGGSEEIRLDTRIIAATNKDLEPEIAAGRFREDLYYRLNVVPIHMPPLRERSDDIEVLARHFLQHAANEGLPRRQLTHEAAELLSRQPWRGNVRELKNFVYRMALLAREDTIDVDSVLPLLAQEPVGTPPSGKEEGGDIASAITHWLSIERPANGTIYERAMAAVERPLFAEVLRDTGGNQLRAAQALGINRNTLRKRLSELALDPEEFARRP